LGNLGAAGGKKGACAARAKKENGLSRSLEQSFLAIIFVLAVVAITRIIGSSRESQPEY
jgi:hypothetical protein